MLESELFWCREYVLNSIEVSWKEVSYLDSCELDIYVPTRLAHGDMVKCR